MKTILLIVACLASLQHPAVSAPPKIAEVVLFVATDCPIANSYVPEINRLHEEYSAKGISFLLVYPDPTISQEEIAVHRKEFSLLPPGIPDPEHQQVDRCGATITPEVAVLAESGELLYRGRIDNWYNDYGDRQRAASKKDLRDVLESIAAGESVAYTESAAIGCFIEPLN